MEGLKDKRIELPGIKADKTLPVVLSKQEVKRLLLALLYGCGLRCFEARNIGLSDLDFDRRMLHVRLGKGK